ncbi:MAG: hypothetical protein ABW328_03785 [Ilumatobacteraceae bacterium]
MSADGSTVPATDLGDPDDLLAMLRAIRDADTVDSVDNETVRRRLGWPAAVTADRLTDAKDRLLIWGVRVGGQPGPCYVDLELTVQGERLLRAGSATPGTVVGTGS